MVKTLEEAIYIYFVLPFKGGGFLRSGLGILPRGTRCVPLRIKIERGFGILPGSTKANPRDHVKSISTTVEADTNLYAIRDHLITPKGSYGDHISWKLTHMELYISIIPYPEKRKTQGELASLDPLYGDYIELNDLNEPLELRRDQIDDLMPTIEEVVENMDGYRDQDMGDIILGEPFYKASCVEARRFDGLITIQKW
ncbi:hypothetical protein Tco_0458492 [Tanacetum coccineum]